ncbi:MAG TPA: protein kinase [Gemmatimonadales bacterium]|jgi:serine/threonine-protein kinase|nr:protein kinase [Gemmatimonadales bacterium]
MDEESRSSLADRLSSALAESYALESEIGRGGMGVVYSARDLKLKRRVAIKVLPPELAFRGEIRTRFLREAETAARLSHPNIVPIHAVGEAESLVYFVMGYVDGESLAARLRRRERLPPEEVRRIMKETADALGLAHAMSVIHRDIKPDNILLEGTRRRVVVTDFGIAKALVGGGVGTLTGTGVVIGTPTYMSPEQAAGEREIDARSDLYSLGLVAFEMLVGDPPFQAGTVPGILMKQITEPAPEVMRLRPDCPEDLGHTIMRCLEKNPDDRWPTADALRRALENRVSVPYRRTAAAGSFRTRRPLEPRAGGSRRSPAAAPLPVPASRQRPSRRASREQPEAAPGDGEPPLVRRFRSQFATYVSVNGGLLLLNIVTGIASPWFLFVTIPWGIGVASRYGELWSAGYSWRDVVSRPPARDALPPPPGTGRPARPAGRLPEPKTDDFGRLATQIRQMRTDRAAVAKIVERLAPAERNLLPDVQPTVDALLARAEELARTLSQMEGTVDQQTLDRLDERIQVLQGPDPDHMDPDAQRRLDLLRRQREMLADLMQRRGRVEAQFESCVLAIQNVRFDLLRLRSAGVGAALSDLTSATQQARALSVDVEAAIDAAGEIRQVLGRGTL